MGGRDASLDAALTYSGVTFGGAVLVWLFNSLANVVRGTGDMATPARVTCVGAAFVIPVSPLLIFGWGPFPPLGVAGGAAALLVFYAFGTLALIRHLRSPRSIVRLAPGSVHLRWRLFGDIFKVGAFGVVITFQTNLAIILATGFVGGFGPAAIAGYGIGSRLEYLLIPLVFGLGAPLVAMVGTSIGAGLNARALRTAWLGAIIAVAITETIGLAAAAYPYAWLTLFDSEPAMLAAGAGYLRIVGPFFGMLGLGLALYFASQGAGRMVWPLAANLARLSIVAAGGWLVLHLEGDLTHLFATLAAALTVLGLTNAAAVAGGAWSVGIAAAPRPATN
jgi:Na+-driven multidrug efflux pump